MKRLLLAATAAFALGTGANAAIIPVLDTVTLVGSEYEFSYSGTLAGDQGVIPGSTLVIYDFTGYVDASISAGIYAADVKAFTELTSTLPAPFGADDDPNVVNLVFRWIGAPFNASGGAFSDVSFSGLTARSTFNNTRLDGFSALAVINNGAATGTPTVNGGFVAVPDGVVVPEPATWTMLIFGFGAAGAMLRTRRRAIVA